MPDKRQQDSESTQGDGILRANQPGPTSRLAARKNPPPDVAPKTGTDAGEVGAEETAVRLTPDTEDEHVRVSGGGRTGGVDTRGGQIQGMLTGSSPQGEEGNLLVARILIERMNHLGGSWDRQTIEDVSEARGRDEQGYDFLAKNESGERLQIQVTKAIGSEEMWESLNRTKSFQETTTAEDLADELRKSVSEKALKSGPHGDVCLALDATLYAAAAARQVVAAFQGTHAAQSKQAEFQQIWVVGPVHEMTFRLDI